MDMCVLKHIYDGFYVSKPIPVRTEGHNVFEEKLLIFQDMTFIVCQEMLPASVQPA